MTNFENVRVAAIKSRIGGRTCWAVGRGHRRTGPHSACEVAYQGTDNDGTPTVAVRTILHVDEADATFYEFLVTLDLRHGCRAAATGGDVYTVEQVIRAGIGVATTRPHVGPVRWLVPNGATKNMLRENRDIVLLAAFAAIGSEGGVTWL